MDMNSYNDQMPSQRHQIMNMRAYSRNIPSQPLQPYLDSRPVLTKYSVMPIVDPRKPSQVNLVQRATYTPETVYNPGNNPGPWSGYASNVNHESELRNQIYALQSCSQSVYVPSSKSSLYEVKWQNNGTTVSQPFPDLFKQEKFCPTNPNQHPDKIGYALFNNATRQQVKDLTDSK